MSLKLLQKPFFVVFHDESFVFPVMKFVIVEFSFLKFGGEASHRFNITREQIVGGDIFFKQFGVLFFLYC
jgi:hypothetical protein